MMAGRNISATHVAFTSARVMATCAVIGQAVGTAAATCVERGVTPRDVAKSKPLLTSLQQNLLRQDQTLRDVRNEDPSDLARKAAVKASAEEPDASAAQVINGWILDIPKKQANHWAAALAPKVPGLNFPGNSRKTIREIQITFDTGFHRELTLSSFRHGDPRNCARGPAGNVRDYQILYRGSPAANPAPVLKTLPATTSA